MNNPTDRKLIPQESENDPNVNWLHPDHWKGYTVPTDYKGDLDNVDSTFNRALMTESSGNGMYMQPRKDRVWWVSVLVIGTQILFFGSLIAVIVMLVKWRRDLSERAFVLNTTLTCLPPLSIISVILTPLMAKGKINF